MQSAARIGRKDFRLFIGSNEIVCDRFQAAFVSPTVAKLLSLDPTTTEYFICDGDSRSIKILEKLLEGETFFVEESEVSTMKSLCEGLGNSELGEQIVEFLTKDVELTKSNCISQFKMKSQIDVSIVSEITFIASHFWEMNIEDLRSLKSCEVEFIVDNEEMCIESEDQFFDIVFNLGSDYFSLLGHVQVEFLSLPSIDRFFEIISYENLDDRLWSNILRRLRHEIVHDKQGIDHRRFRSHVCTPESPFSGFINYLTSLCGGNVHERGVVNITSSSDNRNKCWEVVNFDWNNYWYSHTIPRSWIQFDFKTRNVFVTHYTLKSAGHNGYHLLQWTLAGSRDRQTWESIDSRQTEDLKGNYITKTFSCSNQSGEARFYRYIRLTQTGNDSSGRDHLMLSNFELFGKMRRSLPFHPSSHIESQI
jgi:hypothetical protein